jgi:hypothetical protein
LFVPQCIITCEGEMLALSICFEFLILFLLLTFRGK